MKLEDIHKICLSFPNEERRQWVSDQFKNNKIDGVEMFDGIDMLNSTPEELNAIKNSLEIKIERPIAKGNMGSFMAHRRLWKHVLEHGHLCVWVMEDDPYFKETWRSKLEASLHLLNTQKPTIIKMCAFHTDSSGLQNTYPPNGAKKIGSDLYLVKRSKSNLSFIGNRAFFLHMWRNVNKIVGLTVDNTMQNFMADVDCYAFYPNTVLQACELKSIRTNVEEPQLGGWSISKELFIDICDAIPEGSTICELGSGSGTHWLSKKYNVISIEQDERYINKHQSTYIHAPIKNGWYDLDAIKEPIECAALLVDGPTGISRSPLIKNFGIFKTKMVIFDDVNRKDDLEIARQFCIKHGFTYKEIRGDEKQHVICIKQ